MVCLTEDLLATIDLREDLLLMSLIPVGSKNVIGHEATVVIVNLVLHQGRVDMTKQKVIIIDQEVKIENEVGTGLKQTNPGIDLLHLPGIDLAVAVPQGAGLTVARAVTNQMQMIGLAVLDLLNILQGDLQV